MAHKPQVLAAGLVALVLTLALVGWGLGAGRSAPPTPRPAITPAAPSPSATVPVRVRLTLPPSPALPTASAILVPATSPLPASATVAPALAPASPTPTPAGTLGAAEILSRVAQATHDPRVFGVQSYHGRGLSQSGSGGPGNEWPLEVWYQAPGHLRLAVDGKVIVVAGDNAWLTESSRVELLRNARDLSGPASGGLGLLLALPDGAARLLRRESLLGRAAYIIEITPHPMGLKDPFQGVAHVRVWLDAAAYVPLRIEEQGEGGSNLLTWALTSFEVNPPLDPTLFAFTLPIDTTVVADRAPSAAELGAIWQQIAAQVSYPLFRPGPTPAGLIALGGPGRERTDHGWVRYAYAVDPPTEASVAGNSGLEIIELPAPKDPVPSTGTSSAVGSFTGRYEEGNGVRWLVLDQDGTEVWLVGRGTVGRDALFSMAASLVRVTPLAAAPPGSPTPVPAGPHYGVGTLRFVDAQHGWFLGDCPGDLCARPLLATTDGGQTWQPRRSPPVGTQDMAFATAADGWAFGTGLFATHDGGMTWAAGGLTGEIVQVAAAGASVWVLAQSCRPDPLSMGAACTLTVRMSADRGRTWPPGPDLASAVGATMIRTATEDGWLLVTSSDQPGGGTSRLLVTHDAGKTWRALPALPAATCSSRQLAGYPDGHLWLLCGSQPGAGSQLKSVYLSADWGAHWTQMSSNVDHLGQIPGGGYLEALAVSGPLRAWMALTRGTLYGTTDGGHTWDPAIPADLAEPGDSSIGDVVFADGLHGWLITMSALFRTTDGGADWAALPHP